MLKPLPSPFVLCSAVRVDDRVQTDRCFRHGWGDTTLLKEDGSAGTLHPRGSEAHKGKIKPHSPRGRDGRNGLFGVLQMIEQGGVDSWIGNGLIDPSELRMHSRRPHLMHPTLPAGRHTCTCSCSSFQVSGA